MFGKKPLAVSVIDGVAINEGEKEVDYVARVNRIKEGKDETTQRELAVKEFNAIKSKCLTCKNSFWQQYIPSPNKKDPLDLMCKIKFQLLQGIKEGLDSWLWECEENRWQRKILNCSDYEEKI